MVNLLVWAIIILAGIVGFAWAAKWIISEFFSEPIQKVALLLVGAVLLIVLILAAAQLFGGGGVALGPSPFRLR